MYSSRALEFQLLGSIYVVAEQNGSEWKIRQFFRRLLAHSRELSQFFDSFLVCTLRNSDMVHYVMYNNSLPYRSAQYKLSLNFILKTSFTLAAIFCPFHTSRLFVMQWKNTYVVKFSLNSTITEYLLLNLFKEYI